MPGLMPLDPDPFPAARKILVSRRGGESAPLSIAEPIPSGEDDSPQGDEPLHLGRYEVLGRVAEGGMAEIVLGRLNGPSGFERTVAIKRILPHLARSSGFVDMFLDEARIAARIQHPNVVQVHELGQVDEELFIVMEYLEGESVLSLLRRLSLRRQRLAPHLAAYICAAASAGLHAAHELADLDGYSQGLVHRDISPQNVFVTYDGGVKILDFGIAKAADRITKTEAGELKGKFAYMSPEQVQSESLDRRSDIFALGIVLYEMVTAKRLFKRPTPVATIDAVRKAEIPPPRNVVPSLPKALSDICLKALSKDRDGRYQNAAEFRRALLAFAGTSSGDQLPEEELATLMAENFSDRIDDKREMLRRSRSGSALTHIPAGDTDDEISIPTVRTLIKAPPRKSALGLAISALLVLGVGLVTFGVSRFSTPEIDPAAGPASSLTPETVPEPPAETTEAAPASPAIAAEATLDSIPSGATVRQGERTLGQTPLTLPPETFDLELTLEGHHPERWQGQLLPDETTEVRLRPLRRSSSMRRSRRRRPEAETEMSAEMNARQWTRF